jgi:hypothetical protein
MASRTEASLTKRMMGLIKKGPDVAKAAKVGEPTLVEPEPVAATTVVRGETFGAAGVSEKSVGVEVIKPEESGATGGAPAGNATPGNGSPFGTAATVTTAPPANDANELKPTAPADANELKPTDTGVDPSLPPPVQVNEIQNGQSSSSATAANGDNTPASDEDLSSSKKKRKKGLKKIVPF